MNNLSLSLSLNSSLLAGFKILTALRTGEWNGNFFNILSTVASNAALTLLKPREILIIHTPTQEKLNPTYETCQWLHCPTPLQLMQGIFWLEFQCLGLSHLFDLFQVCSPLQSHHLRNSPLQDEQNSIGSTSGGLQSPSPTGESCNHHP